MEQVRVAQAIIESAARAAEYIQALKSTFVDELLVHGERLRILYGREQQGCFHVAVSTWSSDLFTNRVEDGRDH